MYVCVCASMVRVAMYGSLSGSSTQVEECPATRILTGEHGLKSLPLIKLVRTWQVSSSLQTSQWRW